MKVVSVIRALLICSSSALAAQQTTTPPQPPPVAKLVAEPARITVKAGESAPLKVTAYDAQGNAIPNARVFVNGPLMALSVGEGTIKGLKAGSFTAVAVAQGAPNAPPVTLEIPVLITWPALSKLEIVPEPGRLYVGVMLAHTARGSHADGSPRPSLTVTWRSSDPSVATVDRFGNVTALKPGATTVSAEAEGVSAQQRYTIAPNPVTSVELSIKETTVRTGDVVRLSATAKRSNGAAVDDAKIAWSFIYTPDDTTAAPGGPAIIDHVIDRDVFTANAPGRFTLIAQSGTVTARTVIDAKPRDVRRRITVTGRGSINRTHTSDLWPWTGKDGRDYALVGTWGGDGYGMIFDITDLNNPVKTDSIQVDARTINDVTVSPDGRYGVMTKEGAANRVNGVVILDLATPAHPKIASVFSEDLTGGVHNVFATNDYLFAISGGQKYIIIDVKDITKPRKVGEYKHPNAYIHDLWVRDGIAYSAQYGAGTVVVDVGNGKYGGSVEKPKLITVFPINSGHEIYPYYQKATGKTYLFIGDEEMNRQGRVWEGTNYWNTIYEGGGLPQTSGGYTHIVDFTDPMHPKKVGRYHLEDYGSHDIIVEDDVLYQAYYDGGVRVVDVSGELLGNLAEQRREIAVYKPYDPKGFTANAPFVMNAMPWKGHVLFTDFNSGLWAAKLEPKTVTP
ncbi:MAG TPA: Ig-like domain-containing protein [Gemmatimonadaceae bacterium]|nr:Ig-like domain-containing protein [Gemmatimonadaceae bacterium]